MIKSALTVFLGILFSADFLFSSPVNNLQIIQLFTKNGCAPDQIKFESVSLVTPSDRIYYCQSECGANACTYSIYIKSGSAYIYSGQFSGRYQILPGAPPKKIKVEHPLTEPRELIYKDKQYQ